MKKFVRWLAKVFKAEITVDKIVYVDRIIEKYLPDNGEITGNVTIDGDLKVTGALTVTGEITCYKIKEGDAS
ncbi:hypothetical protein [Parabacteroides sp.]